MSIPPLVVLFDLIYEEQIKECEERTLLSSLFSGWMEQRMEEENVVALTEEGVKALENIHVCNDNTLQMMVLLVKAPSEEENINLSGSFTLLGTKEKKN